MITVTKLVGMKMIPEYRTYHFDGTEEDWRAQHYQISSTPNQFCAVGYPCDGCLRWAHEQTERQRAQIENDNE